MESKLTRKVQTSLEECTVHVPLSRRNYLVLTSEEKVKNRAKREWNRWKRVRDRRKYREVRDIVIGAKKKVLEQVESADLVNWNCCQLLRALGRGGVIPTRVLGMEVDMHLGTRRRRSFGNGDRNVFGDKEKAEPAVTFLEEVFATRIVMSRVSQRRADKVWDRFRAGQELVGQEPVLSVARAVVIIKSKQKKNAPG